MPDPSSRVEWLGEETSAACTERSFRLNRQCRRTLTRSLTGHLTRRYLTCPCTRNMAIAVRLEPTATGKSEPPLKVARNGGEARLECRYLTIACS